MIRLRCPECGTEFDTNAVECPNCGYPAGECEQVIPPGNQMVDNTGTNSKDQYSDIMDHVNNIAYIENFYKHEKTVKTWANVVFYFCLAISALILALMGMVYFTQIVEVFNYYDSIQDSAKYDELTTLFSMVYFAVFIYTGVIVLIGYLTRAFMHVYADMSINLHEINRKMK